MGQSKYEFLTSPQEPILLKTAEMNNHFTISYSILQISTFERPIQKMQGIQSFNLPPSSFTASVVRK